jgi:hypothetical protein
MRNYKFNKHCSKCNKQFTLEFRLLKHEQQCKGFTLCKCGCGQAVLRANSDYLSGHFTSKGSREKAAKTLKDNYKNHPEIKQQISTSVSKTKLSEVGNLRLRNALEKCKDQRSKALKGRKAWNKLCDDEKIKKICLFCGNAFLVTPAHKKQKFCSKKCIYAYKTGKPALNWNIKSKNWGKAIAGKYRGILFRSSFELSFLIHNISIGNKLIAEPFRIPLYKYVDEQYRINIKSNRQFYSPDYMINDKDVVEIKVKKFISRIENIVKANACNNYCKINNYNFSIISQDDMKDYLLHVDQIKQLVLANPQDFQFFKKRDIKRFQLQSH